MVVVGRIVGGRVKTIEMAAPVAPSPAGPEGAPETLLQYEAPLSVGEGAAGPRGAGEKGGSGHLDEVLNSILPPRCVALAADAQPTRHNRPPPRLRPSEPQRDTTRRVMATLVCYSMAEGKVRVPVRAVEADAGLHAHTGQRVWPPFLADTLHIAVCWVSQDLVRWGGVDAIRFKDTCITT